MSDSLTYGDVFGVLERISRTLGRHVNPTVYSAAEFSKRAREENAFLTRVLKGPKTWVIGSENDLRVLASPGNVLAKELPDSKKYAGLVRSGRARLKGAKARL